jgi:hypothetical protein
LQSRSLTPVKCFIYILSMQEQLIGVRDFKPHFLAACEYGPEWYLYVYSLDQIFH